MAPSLIRKVILPCADPESEKGKNTFEWHLPEGKQITVYYRKKGETAGGHYHKGTDPSKNPELFLLVSGKASVRQINKNGEEVSHMVDAKEPGGQPVSLTIGPYVFHSITALTDIIYIEFRVTRFNKNNSDTHSDFKEFSTKVLEK